MPTRAGKKSLAQTPAPKSERIYGSKKNPKGSAKSEKSAKTIKLDDKIISSLENKLLEFKKEHPKNKKVQIEDLKAVYRRGAGAYSSSHRPTITGGRPNTRNAWAMARVNKFLKKASGEKVKKAYVQDDDLLENGGETYYVSENQKQFYKWYINWYKGISKNMNIMFSLPNQFYPIKENDVIILELFEKTNPNINAKIYLQEIVDKADELGITIYIHPSPRHKYIIENSHKNKITKEYIISYFKKYGFILTKDGYYMKRPPNIERVEVIDKMAKGGLLAPNGKPSNLTPEQWNLVRTPEFKAWFGDWEKDPENASKVVDENGEPLICYHGTHSDFNTFKFGEFGFHFGTIQQAEKRIVRFRFLNMYYRIIPCFLNLINPIITKDLFDWESQDVANELLSLGIFSKSEHKTYKYRQKGVIIDTLLAKKIDGIKYLNLHEGDGYSYSVFKPNQIKLADGSNKTFDADNPDIRYDEGGELDNYIYDIKLDKKYHEGHPHEENQEQYNGRFGEIGRITWRTYPNDEGEVKGSIYISSIGNETKYGKGRKKGEATKALASLFLKYPKVKMFDYEDESYGEDYSFWKRIGGTKYNELHRDDFFKYFENKFGYNPDMRYATGGEITQQTTDVFNRKIKRELSSIKSDVIDSNYKGDEIDRKINEIIAYKYLQYVAKKLGLEFGEIEFENQKKEPKNHFQMFLMVWDKNDYYYLQGIFVHVNDNHQVDAEKSNIYLLDKEYDRIKNIHEPKRYLEQGGGIPEKIIYTAIFCNKHEIVDTYGQIHPNLFSHHSTIAFRPNDISDLPIGETLNLKVLGRFTNDRVDALIVDNQYSKNKYPHITLSTAEGVKPFETNIEIEKNPENIKPISGSLKGIIGYFNGEKNVTNINGLNNQKLEYGGISDMNVYEYLEDSNGRKKIVYHGSKCNVEIQKFDTDTYSEKRKKGIYELGTHFGTKHNERALENTSGVEPKPYYLKYKRILRLENVDRLFPLTMGTIGRFLDELPEEIVRGINKKLVIRNNDVQSIKDAIEKEGYDLIEYRNYLEDNGNWNYIAFNSHQIESVIKKFDDGGITEEPDDWDYDFIYYKEDDWDGKIAYNTLVDKIISAKSNKEELKNIFGNLSYEQVKTERYILSSEEKIEFRNVEQDNQRMKPKGLWYAFGDAWAKWIKYEMPQWKEQYKYLHHIKKRQSVLLLDTLQQALEFTQKYGYKTDINSKVYIDWISVAKDWDGIEVSDPATWSRVPEYEHETLFWLYGWDVPSGCIWNKRGIKSIKMIYQKTYSEGGSISPQRINYDSKDYSFLVYHEKNGNFFVPKDEIYAWIYDVPNAGKKLQNEEYDWIFYPPATISMAFQRGFIPPMKRVWTKKFQKDKKGAEHLLGMIQGRIDTKNKKLYIKIMSVKPTLKKKGIMSYMINKLRDKFKIYQQDVIFIDLTKEGSAFEKKKKYNEGGDMEYFNKKPLTIGENQEFNKFPTYRKAFDIIENTYSSSGIRFVDMEDGVFDNTHKAKQYVKEIYDILKYQYDKKMIPVYRVVMTDEVDLDPYMIGESWSFDLESAKNFGRRLGAAKTSELKIISGYVQNSNVDWNKAFENYAHFSSGLSSDDENELPIPANNKIHNVQVWEFNNAKELEDYFEKYEYGGYTGRKLKNGESKYKIYEYCDYERFDDGGKVSSTKDVIVNKIGWNEEIADFLIGQAPKLAIWIADATMKRSIKKYKSAKDYAEKPINEQEIKKWIIYHTHNTASFITHAADNKLRSVLDWLKHPITPKQNLRELTWDDAIAKSKEWHDTLSTMEGEIDYKEEGKIIMEFPEDENKARFYWVDLETSFCDEESNRMGHCGRTSGSNTLFSLRSNRPFGKGHTINESHVTIAFNKEDGFIFQSKGKKNQKPSEKYHKYIYKLILRLIKEDKFYGFRSEYDASDDYGFTDMSDEEVKNIYELKPEIFSNLSGQITLYQRGIIKEKPNTIIIIDKPAKYVDELFDYNSIKNFGNKFIEEVLSGEYLYDYDPHESELEYAIDYLNEKNENLVIEEIAKITKKPIEEIKDNGIKYYLEDKYLGDEDEEYDFDNIKNSLFSTIRCAVEGDAYDYYYKQIKNGLSELGEVLNLGYEGVRLKIDLLNVMELSEIVEYSDYLDSLERIFVEALDNGDIIKPELEIDDRWSPSFDREQINNCFELY